MCDGRKDCNRGEALGSITIAHTALTTTEAFKYPDILYASPLGVNTVITSKYCEHKPCCFNSKYIEAKVHSKPLSHERSRSASIPVQIASSSSSWFTCFIGYQEHLGRCHTLMQLLSPTVDVWFTEAVRTFQDIAKR